MKIFCSPFQSNLFISKFFPPLHNNIKLGSKSGLWGDIPFCHQGKKVGGHMSAQSPTKLYPCQATQDAGPENFCEGTEAGVRLDKV